MSKSLVGNWVSNTAALSQMQSIRETERFRQECSCTSRPCSFLLHRAFAALSVSCHRT
jgi:hypothetical protein